MTTFALSTHADALREFSAEVRRVDFKVDSEFQRILQQAQELLELSDQEIGDALSVSRPTVNRWINGKNLPYNAMRKPVFSWIEEQLVQKVRKIETIRRSRFDSSNSSVTPRYERIAAKSRE